MKHLLILILMVFCSARAAIPPLPVSVDPTNSTLVWPTNLWVSNATPIASAVLSTLTGNEGDVLTKVGATWQGAAPTGGSGGGTLTIAVFMPIDSLQLTNEFTPSLGYRGNGHRTLDFDESNFECTAFGGVIPQGADMTGGLNVILSVAARSATSGTNRFRISFQNLIGQDLDADGYDTATNIAFVANGTSGIITTNGITISTVDSLISGNPYTMMVCRETNSGTFTMSGDAQLLRAEIQKLQ